MLAWPEAAQAAVAIVATCALLRGQAAGGCVAAVVGAHAALLAVSPGFRRRMNDRWQSAWTAASQFPLAGRRIPWMAVLVLVVVPDAIFLLVRDRGMQSGDSRPVVMTAASLVRQGDAELSEFVPIYVEDHLFTAGDATPYFFLQCRHGVYSHYPSGMVPLALPVVAAADLAGCDLTDPTVHERWENLAAAWLSAACLGLFFLLALHIAAPRPAYAAVVLLATGSVMFSTVGQALWQHGGVIFWLELLLLVEFRSFRGPSWKTVAIEGASCGMMLACRLSSGLIVVAFGVWLLLRSPVRAIEVAMVALLVALPWALMNQSVYGSPLGPMVVQAQEALWSFSDAGAWAGILLSPTHGLLIYQPWIWLLPLAAAPRCAGHSRSAPSGRQPMQLPRAILPRGWQAWAMAVIVGHLALVSGWRCWWGGWCWGSRLASEVIPLAALLVLTPLAALWASRAGRRLVVALILASALLHVPSVYLEQGRWYSGSDSDRFTASLWRWTSPPFLFPLRR